MLDDEPAGVEKSESQLNDYFNSSTKVRIFIHIPHIFNVKRVKKDIYNSRIDNQQHLTFELCVEQQGQVLSLRECGDAILFHLLYNSKILPKRFGL